MSFARLAQVELQLIMHACDLRSLLALARCCRFSLAAASHDFAFSCLSPVGFRSTRPNLAGNIRNSLLRFADIGVRWAVPKRSTPFFSMQPAPLVSADEMNAIVAIPRLRSLDVGSRAGLDWTIFLKLPGLANLTALTGGQSSRGAIDTDATKLLAIHQPQLRTLHLPAVSPPDISDSNVAPVLPPLLTDLLLRVFGPTEPELLALVKSCTCLTRLTLINVGLWALEAWLTLPNLQSLLDLTLDSPCNDGELEPAQFVEVFESLHRLQRLALVRFGSVSDLLPALASPHSDQLRALCIEPVNFQSEAALPSVDESLRLTRRLPELTIVIDLPAYASVHHPRDQWHAISDDKWTQLHQRVETIQAQTGSERVRLICSEENLTVQDPEP